ncbi:sigma-54-dependent Fis family transcriptional regulator [bacterium]|nr:sigma-54-dependent Fis family transcriptional regulator [bacterium]
MTEKTRPKVLIVDDVSANLEILRDAIKPEGYKIFAASNGEDALRITSSALPDIILLDIMMEPGMDSYEVCSRLKQNEETSHIPVIFITVKEDKESLIKGFQVGGVDYITKPFYEDEVRVRVRTHLQNSLLTQEVLRKNRELQEEIARRERAEDALETKKTLHKLKGFTEMVFNTVDDSISVIDATTFRIMEVNRAFLKRAKMNKIDIIGKYCHEINHKASKCESDTCPLEATVKTGTGSSVEHIHYDKYGKEIYVEVSTYPLRNEKGEIYQVIHIARDITERKRTEEALKKADEQLSIFEKQEASHWGIVDFVGRSRTIRGILDEVHQLQNADKINVLITGESGTGKELIARAIHSGSKRAKGRFIPRNCSTIPKELAEATLFGHIRGAFTGANETRIGYFELADGGTLFLDEIGDMHLELQAKLLRVLDDGCITPVGSNHSKQVDVRILTATNTNLQMRVAEGGFREDLYFRLAQFYVNVPPLRERKEDISLLVEHFLKMFAAEMGIQEPDITPEAMSALETYHFPGNVRELKNIIERALIKSGGSQIQPEHLHFIDNNYTKYPANPTLSVKSVEYSEDFEQRKQLVIKRARKQHTGNEELTQQAISSGMTKEEKILAYVEEHGSINNSECRSLLSVDFEHAAYLLRKLHQYGLLLAEGERRWRRYRLPLQ